jgi:hypothetical protein
MCSLSEGNYAMTDTMSKAEMLARIQQAWDDFHIYLNTLSEEQLTTPTDAAGLTAKDHVMHLAVWEDGTIALLNGHKRREQMGVDEATWDTHDYDKINGVIQQHYQAKPLAEVLQAFAEVHQRLLEKLGTLTDEDLQRPYSFYQSTSDNEHAVIGWISGNTYEHYAEHTPWIAAIVEKS